MRARLIYLVVAVLVLMPISLSAQSRALLSREALDSLVNPSNSPKAVGSLSLSQSTIDLGNIEDDEVVYFNFEVRNLSQRTITITEFRPSCSCIKVLSKPQSIAPDATFRVSASFNPAGRSSAFGYRVNIYTDLDSQLPSERVMVEGRVVNDDVWLHLPYRAGVLRLSRKEVTLTSRGEERIVVANSGDKPITITAKPTVEGLSLRCEPEVLQPGCEGEIVVWYRGDMDSELDTILILEGVEASPIESVIKIKLR
ncbi:MAG: DUF1573 domain-containing protein [Alistipes sp.]|nr:DUF1573 domain-containing protein [Alistipes sp.]